MFANTQAGGTDFASPDVCLTPPVPAPVAYPNFADGSIAVEAVYHVLYAGAPAHNLGTVVPSTSGDDPGVAGGVSSGTVMGQSVHVTAAFTVLTGGLPTTRLTSMTLQNNGNVSGSRMAPSQLKLLILSA